MACQHFPDDQTLWLQTGAGEDGIIHLPSCLDRIDCELQEEEEEGEEEEEEEKEKKKTVLINLPAIVVLIASTFS